MKILIVDDETLGLSRLKRLLNSLGYENIEEASSANDALEAINKERFDLAFLDINMPDISGLELAYEIKLLQSDLPIVFQTAYEEHALKAFDIGALGYLVKPYSIEQLKQVIERVDHSTLSATERFYFMSKNGENYYMLKPEEIYYVKADLTEVMFRTKEGFSYYPKKISEIEDMLDNQMFTKVHRSYLINIDKIKSMETIEQSKLRFNFSGIDDEVESSKDGAKAFRQRFHSKY